MRLMRLNSNWLLFDIEGLKSDPTLETAMSMVIANAVADRASGRTGQPSITVLDECWARRLSLCHPGQVTGVAEL